MPQTKIAAQDKTKTKNVAGIQKKFFARYKEPLTPVPNLIEAQNRSFQWILEEGIKEIFQDFTPINDFTEKKFSLEFHGYEIGEPQYDEHYAKQQKLSYEAPLKVKVKLINHVLGSEEEQEIFMADFPLMTSRGTFIIAGIERVIVPQLARSYGVFFTSQVIKGATRFGSKIIPTRGAWVEFETDADNALYVRIDRKRKLPISTLLRVLGPEKNEEIKQLFSDDAKEFIEQTLAKDTIESSDDAAVEIYKRLRDGDIATPENAKEFVNSLFGEARYDFSRVGRFSFNKRFNKDMGKKELERRTLSVDDIVTVLEHIVTLNITPGSTEDDIDHLGSRRVRYVGELFQQKFRVGLSQIKRNIQNRMSTIETDVTLPVQFISAKPLQARIKEFFTTNQLSQFMQQENPLGELEHLRTLSALGPGGLSRARAGFEVRDVHASHYGRVCPIQTPEGPNIGLILRLSTYAQVNDFGMIETPYAKVEKGKVTKNIEYLNAMEEEKYTIAHAGTDCKDDGSIIEKTIEARRKGNPVMVPKSEIDYIDVATNQAFSIAPSLIPFLNHDDASRALMGSNMQRQATPCLIPEAPVVATGAERRAIADTNRLAIAEQAGVVSYVDANKVTVKNEKGKHVTYELITYNRTNDSTVFHQRPLVNKGDKVKKGDVLADSSSSDRGELALGQNMRVGFLSWQGANYEDAIIINEDLVKEKKFSTIHTEEFVVNVRDTKLGPEVTTCDIPNVGEAKLKNLAEDGIVRVGAEVEAGDILVGKITPKGETQLTPEERLLRSLFGEKARDVKDSSKRLQPGKRGRVINVKVFSREQGDKLDSGIIKRVHIEMAQVRNISVGDKLAGRHGNKGVISRILPAEDMPYDDNGQPLDVILTPLGVPSRMNLGQILELHLGLAAHTLDYQAIVPPFSGATGEEIRSELKKAGFQENGKMRLFDGRTGIAYEQDVAVGYMYILKLHHMVEDKVHQRSIGPYSLITQQPLGGKAQGGGQRFGEMEVWALLGYGAAYNLREVLTIKSDDIMGRSAAFDSIVKGEPITQINTPASFNVLLNYLRGLALDVHLHLDGEEPGAEQN